MPQPSDNEIEVFNVALELPRGERAAYLERVCAGDAALRQRVEELLKASEDSCDFLEGPDDVATGAVRFSRVPTEKAGDRIGRYKLLQQIGEGGCGVVYMAEQEEPVRRRVALKVIKLGMDTRSVIARFEAERQALALMDHPNIAKVLDAGATETGRPYFVMELVRGVKITDYCDQNNLPTQARLELFVQVCRAVQHAHQKGIIHRDLKPSNILVTVNDDVAVPKVIDFGIAKATQGRLTDSTLFTAFEQFIGTPAYVSPEQAVMTSLDVDTRSDIYSLGVLLYELLTGRTPFDSQELLQAGLDEMRRTIREREPPKPSTRLRTLGHNELTATANRRQTEAPKLIHLVRGDMDWIVMKCLAKERTRRYETANGLARDIERHLCHEPVSAFPPSRLYELRKTVRRHWVGFGATTAVLVALTIGTVVSTLGLGRARRAEREQSQWRQEAQTAAAAAKRTLALSDLSEAVRLSEAHEGGAALAYLGRILSAEPTNSAALTRAATLLMYRSWMVPTIIVPQGNWVSAEFSPDGTRFLTASWDNTARIWDSQTGALVTPPLGLRKASSPTGLSARFSPDGARVLTGSGDGTARVWDARTGAPLTPWMDHGCLVGSLAFSPNGTRVATGDLNGSVRVWNAQTGTVELGPLPNGTYTCWVEFSPDGQWIATGCRPGVARVWNALTGKERCPPMKHGASVLYARFSPDGKWIVTASRDGTARVWDAESGQPLTDPLRHDDQVLIALFSPDGKRILTASRDQTARVWDASTGQPLTKPLPHRGAVGYAEFSADGRRIVTAATDHFARLWDALTGLPLAEPLYHGGEVGSARFSPNGRRILTGGQDAKARIWEPLGHPALAEPVRHRAAVVSVQFSPDASRFVTASRDGTAHVWAASTCAPITPALVHGTELLGAEFSPDGKRVLTASLDHTAQLWDAFTGARLGGAMKHGGGVPAAHFAPDGDRIVTASYDGKARIWDASGGRLLAELPHRDSVMDAVFSPDGAWVATASRDGTARVWDGRTGAPRTASLAQSTPLVCARFSPDGKQIVTGAEWGGARIWDARSGQSLAVLSHLNRVISAEFSPDSQLILTACWDGAARVWDAQTGLLRHEPLQHANALSWAHFSPNGRQVFTGSERDARLWDTQSGQPVSEPFGKSAPIQAAQFSSDGQRVLCGSIDGTVKVWDLAPTPAQCPDWLLPLMEAVSGQVLNGQGFLEETRLDRVATINETRRRLAATAGDDPWTIFGRWFLAEPATRTISPFAKITMPEFIARRLEEGGTDAIEDAHPGADLAAYESFCRQELADRRRNWPNEPARWQSSITRLIALLQHEGRFSEAAGVYQDVLRPSGPPNLLVNGSFEFGNFTDSAGGNTMALLPGSARITGWVVTGEPGLDLEWFGAATSEGLTAADGHRFLDLTGFHDRAPYDGVSQTISTMVGQEYRVSFAVGSSDHWDRDVHPGVEVEVTGIKPMLWTVADIGTNRWETFAFTFTAIATNTTLKFTGSATNNVQYIGLDNVVVTPASAREP